MAKKKETTYEEDVMAELKNLTKKTNAFSKLPTAVIEASVEHYAMKVAKAMIKNKRDIAKFLKQYMSLIGHVACILVPAILACIKLAQPIFTKMGTIIDKVTEDVTSDEES